VADALIRERVEDWAQALRAKDIDGVMSLYAKVAAALTPIVQRRGAPTAITVDNVGEFVSRAMDAWAYAHDVRLEFRPGKPVENAFHRKLQWPAARRMPERRLRIADRSPARTRRLAPRLQSRPPAKRLAGSDAGGDGHSVRRLT